MMACYFAVFYLGKELGKLSSPYWEYELKDEVETPEESRTITLASFLPCD